MKLLFETQNSCLPQYHKDWIKDRNRTDYDMRTNNRLQLITTTPSDEKQITESNIAKEGINVIIIDGYSFYNYML